MITCATNCRRRGVALPIAFLALILVIGMVTSISTMNQGLKSQVFHSSNNQWSFLLAYSAMSRLLAKIHAGAWAQRPFASAPYRETGVPLQGGTYDLFVENTPGHPFQADIYVKTSLAGTSRLYFWRITFNDDLLDVSNRIIVEFFKAGEPGDFPATAGPSRFSKLVDDLLTERAANQKKSDEMAVTLGPVTTAKQALEQLGGRQPPPFTKTYPSIPGDPLIPDKPAPTFPVVPPPTNGEVPTSPGPGPSTPLPGDPTFPTMPTAPIPTDAPMFDLNEQVKKIKDTAKLANDKYINGKDVADQGMGGNWAEANPILNEAEEARYKAMAGMNELVSLATANLLNAPSAEAARATEEMVSSTMVTAYQDIVAGVSRAFEDFGKSKEITAGLTTSAAAQELLDGWVGTLDGFTKNQQATNELMDKIDTFSKTPEVAKAQADAEKALQDVVDSIKQAIEDAKAKLAELKAKEEAEKKAKEEAEAAANGGTQGGS
ncbi:MAG: hypothetical protein GX442_11320 [Candidatus Riflebacteria bacterium]|nr:hypothetical protein [Candidatus Riflebacteria bacterium]